ncbi:MAG: vitamin K epoxide reductase family protein [Ktedonobacteraceae bacterium]|nr:vitamin K epoxide reductase family protein [Ktedonobacteraceae bacterium]
MDKKRFLSWQAVLLLLSLVGIGIAIYLTSVHYQAAPLVCSAQGVIDCARVLSSPYSVIPGTSLPISLPGLVWCVVSAGAALAGLTVLAGRRWLYIAQCAWSLSAMLVVLYLVYVEIVRLHTICAWCSALHGIILAQFLITLLLVQQAVNEQEPDVEQEQSVVTARK